jgi:DcmR-like sensory protein
MSGLTLRLGCRASMLGPWARSDQRQLERPRLRAGECQRHESLLNLAFADAGPLSFLCPYDTDGLDAAVIAEAHRSHPWSEGDTLLCEVRDGGRLDDPLAGRRRPDFSEIGGHVLWIANQLCDLVQLRSFAHGSAVRIHMRTG